MGEEMGNNNLKPSYNRNTRYTWRQKISLVMLAIGDFMSVCSMSIISPFFPMVSSNKGVSSSVSGIIFAVYAFIVFVASPIFGKILPKIGAKSLFTIGAFVAGISNTLFGFLDLLDNYALFVSTSILIRIVEGLGASAYSVASYVLIVEIFPDHVNSIRGLLETFMGLGFCAGPVVGGLLYTIGGYGLPFFTTGSVAIALAFINMFILVNPKCSKSVFDNNASLRDLIKLPSVSLTCLITTVTAMSYSFLDPIIEPHLRQTFGSTPKEVALLFLVISATYGIFSPLWGWITDNYSNYSWTMIVGLFATSFVVLLLGPSPIINFINGDIWIYYVGFAALGITTAMTIIPTYQFILYTAENNGYSDSLGTHSTVSGIWTSSYSLGEVIGPILGGVVMDQANFAITSTTIAIINFILAIIALIFFKLRRKSNVFSQDKSGIDNQVYCIKTLEHTQPVESYKIKNESIKL